MIFQEKETEKMKKEQTIEVLNSLITINNDRVKGYETASKETEEQDLKTLFARFVATSKKCHQELANEVKTLGGEVAEGTKTTGKFFRAWMDVKAALTGKNRTKILNSCEFGEDKAQETYENVLEDELENLSTEQQMMVTSQKSLLKADHDHVKTLRDALANA